MLEPRCQADAAEQFACGFSGIRSTGQLQRQHHVFQRSHRWQQVERLKHKAQQTRAQRGAAIFIQREQILPADMDGA